MEHNLVRGMPMTLCKNKAEYVQSERYKFEIKST